MSDEQSDAQRIGGQPAYPPTYPVLRLPDPMGINFGLTKREYAAIAAMQGLLADPRTADDGESFDVVKSDIVESAVMYADALLAELAKEPTR